MRRYKEGIFGILGVLIWSAFFIFSQQAEAQELKVGYVDISRTFDEFEKTKQADKKLEEGANKKQEEREEIVDKIKRMREELELTSEAKRTKLQDQIEENIKSLHDFDSEVKNELKQERDTIVRDILKQIDDVIQEYGRSEEYDLILNDRVLLYRSETLDLTDKIIEILNKKYR